MWAARHKSQGDLPTWQLWEAAKAHLAAAPDDAIWAVIQGLYNDAAAIEKEAVARRVAHWRMWCKTGEPGSNNYRWVREPPPTRFRKCTPGQTELLDIKRDDLARTKPFTDVWQGEAKEFNFPNWAREDACLKFHPPPDLVRSSAVSYATKKAFGSDLAHPKQAATLSDNLIWALITIMTAAV